MVFVEFVLFLIAAILFGITAFGVASTAIWGAFFAACGLTVHALHHMGAVPFSR